MRTAFLSWKCRNDIFEVANVFINIFKVENILKMFLFCSNKVGIYVYV